MSSFEEKSGFTKHPSSLPSSVFNRSLTINHSSEFPGKPYPNHSLERKGSIKSFYNSSFDSVKGKVKKLCHIFESSKSSSANSQSRLGRLSSNEFQENHTKTTAKGNSNGLRIYLPGTEDRVVVYFTSLRGIRRTFEDCYSVRMILRGYRINVDERDISMDSAYKKELQSLLGEKIVTLPQVFVRGKHIGGADVIKQMNEVGELGKLLKGLSTRAPGFMCRGCGDVRFVPCDNCHGSRKIFDEEEGQLRRCLECNENGLIRCPACCF